MNVAVYGNLIYDQIAILEKPFSYGSSNQIKLKSRIGGIANFVKASDKLYNTNIVSSVGNDTAGAAIKKAFNQDTITVNPTYPTTQALVIADPFQKVRTGLVQWGACSAHPLQELNGVDWHHIMYLDKTQIPKLEKFKGIVSVDFCDSHEIDNYRDLLQHIDYLIISEPDNHTFIDKIFPVRKNVIVHGPSFSYIMNNSGKILSSQSIETVDNLNVVGAGDYFAAFCIANLLKDGNPQLELIHDNVLHLLKEQS